MASVLAFAIWQIIGIRKLKLEPGGRELSNHDVEELEEYISAACAQLEHNTQPTCGFVMALRILEPLTESAGRAVLSLIREFTRNRIEI